MTHPFFAGGSLSFFRQAEVQNPVQNALNTLLTTRVSLKFLQPINTDRN